MKAISRVLIYAVLILTLGLASAMAVTPVYAEDPIPPATETTIVEEAVVETATPEPTLPPTEETTVETSTPEPTLSPTEEMPATTEAAPTNEEVVPAAEDELAEVLAQVPEGTEIVVLDENGEPLALASEEAAAIIYEGDPIWCPVGIAPIANTGGCTGSFSLFNGQLLPALAGKTGAGVIWIASSYNSAAEGGSVTLDGNTLTSLRNYSLTLQGGWDGVSGSLVVDPLSPSFFTVPLSIINWQGDVNLSNIWISGTTGTGLTVSTTKNIKITNVKSYNNSGSGADLDNCRNLGSGCTTAATVTVYINGESEFNNNGLYGLKVSSMGAMMLSDLTANVNGSGGALLENNYNLAVGGITLGGTNIFAENQNFGLKAQSNGAILINNLIAINNSDRGAYLDNTFSSTAKPVTLTGSSQFKLNNIGLEIKSDGAITLNSITAAYNSNAGILLDNTSSTVLGGSLISVLGTNIFSENDGSGFIIYSKGAVTLNNVTARLNGATAVADPDGWGGYIENYLTAAKPVMLTGINIFSENYRGGLKILSAGLVTLNSLTANNNTGTGLVVTNTYASMSAPQNVTGLGYLKTISNTLQGLNITSYGVVSLANVTATDNGAGGAYIDNQGGTLPRAVTLTGTNNFDRNGTTGLEVQSLGIVTLYKVSSSDNLAGYGLLVNNQVPKAVGGINLYGSSTFYNNPLSGLKLNSYGSIIIHNVAASDNGGYGADIDNSAGTGNVALGTTLAGWCNTFESNGNTGLLVNSKGTITLTNICSSSNTGYGAYLTSPKAVTIKGANSFLSNGNTGLWVDSHGTITVYNVTAKFNNGDGATLFNQYPGLLASINVLNTLPRRSDFSLNTGDGLEARSNYTIKVTNLDASGNSGYGVYLHNQLGTAAGVSLGASGYANQFNNNYYSGIEIYSNGIIALTNINATSNGTTGSGYGYGAYVKNDTGTAKGVSLLGINTFTTNQSGGLRILSHGAVALSKVSAVSNTGNGIYVDNQTGITTSYNVTGTGFISANGNTGNGITISTLGVITLANLDAWSNVYGAWLDNHGATLPKAVTLTGKVITGSNSADGIYIQSKGQITFTLTDGNATANGGYGWQLVNNFSGAVGGIKLTVTAPNNIDFSYNQGAGGLLAQSLGIIYVVNIDADHNAGYGAWLNNALTGSVGTVTMTTALADNNSYVGNGGEGLILNSNRTITLANLFADDNGLAGVVIDNSTSGAALPQNVTLTGRGIFTSNGAEGLKLESYGLVTLASLTANNNGDVNAGLGYGAYIDNCIASGACTATIAKNVVLTGTNSFTGNTQDGLWVNSLGAITVNNLSAIDNGADGAHLNNKQGAGSLGGITLTGTNDFELNGDVGLYAFSHGNITINNLTASSNFNAGAQLNNQSLTATPTSVTLTGINNFIGNSDGNAGTHGESGLSVQTDGSITINSLTASENDGFGATLDNVSNWISGTPGTIILTGANFFMKNYSDGLVFFSKGSASMTKITSELNGGNGVTGIAGGSITIACGSIVGNGGYGWSLDSGSLPYLVTLQGVLTYGNTAGNMQLGAGDTLAIVRTCALP